MSKKYTGYIVLNNDSRPLGMDRRTGVLWVARSAYPAAVFSTRDEAIAAIRRSMHYAIGRGRDTAIAWGANRWSVQPVCDAWKRS